MMADLSTRGTMALVGIFMCCASVVWAEPDASRLQSARSLGASKLEPARLHTARRHPARLQPMRHVRLPSSVRALSSELVRNTLSTAEVKGAASGIPPSKLGELFYGVGLELERQEGELTHTAVGYYIAALTDPAGEYYADAKRRLREVLLEDELSHEQAVGLYNGGLATFRDLCNSNLGIVKSGISSGLSDLREIKLAYHAKRAQ